MIHATAPLTRLPKGQWPTPRTGGMCGGTGNWQQLERLREAGVITEYERRRLSQGNGGHTNPTWVSWLMGFPLTWLLTPEAVVAELLAYEEPHG